MKFKQIVGCLLTAAVLLGAQINIWAQNDSTANLEVVARRCHFAVEPGFDGNRQHARTASGDDYACAKLRDDARGDVRCG